MDMNMASVSGMKSKCTKGSFQFNISLNIKSESYLVILCIAFGMNAENFCFAFE